jgi:hypothetical protein
MAKFRIGDRVKLIPEETTQYPSEWQGQTFVIEAIYDHYVPASQMKWDPRGHPGYDESARCPLYGIKDLPNDLYEWEIRRA